MSDVDSDATVDYQTNSNERKKLPSTKQNKHENKHRRKIDRSALMIQSNSVFQTGKVRNKISKDKMIKLAVQPRSSSIIDSMNNDLFFDDSGDDEEEDDSDSNNSFLVSDGYISYEEANYHSKFNNTIYYKRKNLPLKKTESPIEFHLSNRVRVNIDNSIDNSMADKCGVNHNNVYSNKLHRELSDFYKTRSVLIPRLKVYD